MEKSIMEQRRPLDSLAQKSHGKINMKQEPASPFPPFREAGLLCLRSVCYRGVVEISGG